jgi:diguanylate cyclase (GGDEF)-like protein/PAS domain S-box-containing protein
MNTEIQNAISLNRAILDCAGEGIYGLDLNGVTTFANPAAIRMTGWALEDLLGKPQHAQIHHSKADGTPYPRETCPIYAALRDGEIHHREDEVFWRKNATCFQVAYTSTPLREDGKLVGAVVVFRDITNRKNRERWDASYKRVLELVAVGAPLQESLETLIAAVEDFQTGLKVIITLRDSGESPSKYDDLPVCWTRPIVSSSGAGLGSFRAFLSGANRISPSACEILEMACGLSRIAIEHRDLLDQLAHQSTHDVLTGLANRMLFEDRLEQALSHARRSNGNVAVYLIDLDRFKEVNDSYGHAAGDSFLLQAANRIKSVLRDGDTLARMGGDEFAVIIPAVLQIEESAALAQRIVESLRTPLRVDGQQLVGSISVGVSVYPHHGQDSPSLQKYSDQAMYRAKSKGGNRFEIFDPEASILAAEALKMELRLREALEKNWFRLEYQPQFELTGKLIGMEALLRLQAPGERVIEPTQFISSAEETGLIVPIGAWVLREACRQGVEWSKQGYAPLSIAVNVSARQFAGPDFVGLVTSTLQETGFPATLLDLELTESCLMTSAVDSIRQLNQLRKLGVQISIDDFGTGYSSLSRLHQLPVSTIKIDKEFIDRLSSGIGGSEIVQAILSLSKQLGFRVIAEGVEALNRLGPVIVQGFLLGKPEGAASAKRHLGLIQPQHPSTLQEADTDPSHSFASRP